MSHQNPTPLTPAFDKTQQAKQGAIKVIITNRKHLLNPSPRKQRCVIQTNKKFVFLLHRIFTKSVQQIAGQVYGVVTFVVSNCLLIYQVPTQVIETLDIINSLFSKRHECQINTVSQCTHTQYRALAASWHDEHRRGIGENILFIFHFQYCVLQAVTIDINSRTARLNLTVKFKNQT